MKYLGLLRLYSLADLFLLLLAAHFDRSQLIGAVALWIGFLTLLEFQHKHPYRQTVSRITAVVPSIIGLLLLPKIGSLLFIALGFFYTLKERSPYALFSPLIRGLQTFSLIGMITGYSSSLAWIAFSLMTIRNFAGDLRDIERDRREGFRTIPVVFGLKEGVLTKHLHQGMLHLTSFIWWEYSNLSIVYLLFAFLIEISTYHLTPRADQ